MPQRRPIDSGAGRSRPGSDGRSQPTDGRGAGRSSAERRLDMSESIAMTQPLGHEPEVQKPPLRGVTIGYAECMRGAPGVPPTAPGIHYGRPMSSSRMIDLTTPTEKAF